VDPTLADLSRRVAVLRFRNLQDVIASARADATAGRTATARASYERALRATPDSAFLHRELGILERKDGNAGAALEHFRRASALDTSDAVSLVQLGELLEEQQDFTGAASAYRRAAEIEPGAALSARIAAVAEKERDAMRPAEFRAIAAAREITRGDLAALIAVRLEPLLQGVRPREVVATDIAGHWAAAWIRQVARAGVMDPFENHTFQPRARLRRGDLAEAVSRLLSLVAASRPELRTTLAQRQEFTDMAPGHLNYPSASAAVAAGVLSVLDGDRFQVGRAVSGAEAIEAIGRIRTLAGIG
jgi:Flp pilus assembly protein TadD